MHPARVKRAYDLMGCEPGSPEEKALAAIADALEAYEAQRWPMGKIPAGNVSRSKYPPNRGCTEEAQCGSCRPGRWSAENAHIFGGGMLCCPGTPSQLM